MSALDSRQTGIQPVRGAEAAPLAALTTGMPAALALSYRRPWAIVPRRVVAAMTALWRYFSGPEGDVRLHRILLVAWLAITVVATATGLLSSVAFVAACSLYANCASHWGALTAAKAEVEAS